MMKKIMLFAAAIAALAACSKENSPENNTDWFKAGERVTLCIGTAQTKASSSLDGDGGIDFKWESTDEIKVTVSGKSAKFTVSKLNEGGASAEFTGTMPAEGTTFDVQYPYEGVAESALASQTYSSTETLPKGLMLFSKSGCTETSFELEPQYAALRLNLWGTSKTISKIVVTNTTSSKTPKPSYTLNISGGVTLPTTEAAAQAFFIVVPIGDWNFSAEVFDTTPASICTFEKTSTDAYFTASTILNMPAKKVGKFYPGTELEGITIGSTVWAPVNCGYDATDYPYGKLYQWGRKDGCGYNDGSTYTETLIQEKYPTANIQVNGSTVTEYAGYFYWGIFLARFDWLATQDDTRWNSGSESSPVKVTSYAPCPTGWRVPTLDELASLCYTDWDSNDQSGSTCRGSWDSTLKGCKFGDVFLPAAGFRHYENGYASYRGAYGYYWSSSVSGGLAWCLVFYDGYAYVRDDRRAYGYSVRCVQE